MPRVLCKTPLKDPGNDHTPTPEIHCSDASIEEDGSARPYGDLRATMEDDELDRKLMDEYVLTECQIAEIKESFTLYDYGCNGTIEIGDIGDCLRAMGQNPTEKEVTDMQQEAGVASKSFVTYEEFARLVGQQGLKGEDEMEEQLEEAMRVFDKDGVGVIQFSELKDALLQLGEPVTEEDIKEMMKLADIDDKGRLDYKDLARKIAAK